MGDGTGCDNMTAVIIQFKPTILELETSIVTDDGISAARKRSASPSRDDDDINQESHKRIKTDQEKEATTATGAGDPTTT